MDSGQRVVVGVAVLRGARVLAARRAGGGWELPGGKVEPGEEPAAAAVREIAEELGCAVEVTGWLAPTVAIDDTLVLRVATARLVGGEPVPRNGDHGAVRWVGAAEVGALDWLPADVPFVAAMVSGLTPLLS
ncbi:MAG: (deoxy)nucleoside triphosphate pyrophosphohydrolase [Marmoricola sp.]